MTSRSIACSVTLAVLAALTLFNALTIKSQVSRQSRPIFDIPEGDLVTLKGAVGFGPAYQPKPGENDRLKGIVLILKDKKTGKQVGKATTDTQGNFAFNNVPASGNSNPVNTKCICNQDGACWDLEELPAENNTLPLLEVEDPPLKEFNRSSSPARPKIVFKPFTCIPSTRKGEIKLYVKKSDLGKPNAPQPR